MQSRPSNSAGCAYRSADGRPSIPQCSLAHKPRSSDRGYPESEALHTVARDRFLSMQGDEHVPRSQTSDNISVQPWHQGESIPRSPDCESETVPLRYEDASSKVMPDMRTRGLLLVTSASLSSSLSLRPPENSNPEMHPVSFQLTINDFIAT